LRLIVTGTTCVGSHHVPKSICIECPVDIRRQTIFDYLIEVESEKNVLNVSPDISRLRKMDASGVIVTAKSADYDFVSRLYACTPMQLILCG
jgi:predicted PhzF superfamily epimerase YddE/YHI9